MSDEPQVQQTAEGQVEKIGDFEIFKDHLLGKGAWGEVYQGRQVSLERPVAVKILKKELSQDEEFVRRFMREAKCIAKLLDENIIQVHGAGVHEGAYYFAMEFVQGLPLQKFLDRGRKFSTDDIIYIGMAVAKALKAAWESPEQVVHRDIKPANIMVSFSSSKSRFAFALCVSGFIWFHYAQLQCDCKQKQPLFKHRKRVAVGKKRF